MRVLMIRRNNARQIPGGDSLRFGHMQKHLSDLGVEVSLATQDSLPSETNLDLVHLSNLQTETETWKVFLWAVKHKLPTVLSPIFWDLTRSIFDHGPLRTIWRRLQRRIGTKSSYYLFYTWQFLNRPRESGWILRRKLLSQVNWLLPTSKMEVTHLKRYFWLLDELSQRSTVVYSGIDTEVFEEPINRPSGKVHENFGIKDYVLEVGRISPTKNQLRVIKALWDIPVPIVFVGQESPFHHEYVRTCKELAKERGNVYFVDFVQQKELPAIYATAAVHVLPSWRETPGLASIEAAASGCKIVSTDIGCAREYFGDLAWYCDPGDVKSLRSSLELALQSDFSSTKLRNQTLTELTWERAARQTLEGYSNAITHHKFSSRHRV